MNQSQREHIARVVASLSCDGASDTKPPNEPTIRASWQRCVTLHGLDPSRMQEARVLPWHELLQHRQAMEEFRHIAHHGLTALHQQIEAAGYVLMLTDARGVAIDFMGDGHAEIRLRRAGLLPGALWTEGSAGTCAVGTVLATGKPLTVHQAEHFDATHIPLTCSAVPLFDPEGKLMAVLDISALSSPQPKSSQRLALQIATQHAHQIENAWFSHCHRNDWILKLSAASAYTEVNPDCMLAVDTSGTVIGHTHRARLMLGKGRDTDWPLTQDCSDLLGMPVGMLLNTSVNSLPDWLASGSGHYASLELAHSGEKRFVSAVPPARQPLRSRISGARPLPPSLAALNGGDEMLQQQLHRASRLLASSLPLVLQGETGSGKEYFARAFHLASDRSESPFVAVNCAAIPASLIESELFGYLPGSFSGAGGKGQRGLIREADNGTLFLDEIGDMPLEMQTRLLRVLAEQEVLPVGASRPINVNLRVISASHHPLDRLVEEGRFRADLYYRLQGATIALPPLRQRSDLDWLIDTFIAKRVTIAGAARRRLHQYRWPGNLRELSNALEYAIAVSENGSIAEHDLPDTLLNPTRCEGESAGHTDVQQCAEAQLIMRYLRAACWNQSAVARQMGISRMTLYRRMQRYGIQSPIYQD